MRHNPMRQFTLACSILGAAIFLGTFVVVGLSLTRTTPGTLTGAATTIMIVTLVLQLAFVLAQLFPAGRMAIPARFYGPDAWFTVIILTGLPGVFWHRLADLAGTPMTLIMPGFVTPLVISVLLMIARQIQQRNFRSFADRSAPPMVR